MIIYYISTYYLLVERHFFRGDGGGGMGAGLNTLCIIHEQDALKQQGSDMPSICFYNIEYILYRVSSFNGYRS